MNDAAISSRDWLRSTRSSLVAWWVPHATIFAGLFVPTTVRAMIWTTALVWMGVACILNARQCGRTHCRFTGPYYLAMIAPVFALGSGAVSAEIYGWIALAVVIVAGSKLIWWATERAWGEFSQIGIRCLTSASGTSRHFAATQQFGHFPSEADIQRAALKELDL